MIVVTLIAIATARGSSSPIATHGHQLLSDVRESQPAASEHSSHRCHLARTVFPRSAPAIRPAVTPKQSCCPILDHVPRHGTSSEHLDVG